MKNPNSLNKKSELTMFSIVNAFRDNIRHEPMVSLGNSFELLVLISRIGWRVILACSDRPIKLTKRLSQLKGFAGYLLIMSKHHGPLTTVKYLKASQLAIQKRISLDHIDSLRDIEADLPLPRLTRSKLPRFIPLEDRRAILAGNAFVIRFWLTLYSIYRIIKVDGTLNLSTITDPYSGNSDSLSRGFEELKDLSSRNSSRFDLRILKKEYGILALETASPSYRASWQGYLTDIQDLTLNSLDKPLKILLEEFDQNRLLNIFNFVQQDPVSMSDSYDEFRKDSGTSLGQLSIKEEAAGKVRVFALVDVWTQSCLKPLHELLFNFLKSLPNDGTFDQHKSVLRCTEKVNRTGQSFGYDLSAATDRLPIHLQVAVLIPLIGERAALAWKSLLTDRIYKLSSLKYGEAEVKYSVGQPMGALSSWAMLAVSHHLIVQLAYKKARPDEYSGGLNFWYENYELLGDDIVIFDQDVAKSYLKLMNQFGVGINLKKSVVSNNASFEFAKVSWLKGQFVTAISWKMFVSQNNNMGRVNILYHLLGRQEYKHPIRFVQNLVRMSRSKLGDYKFNLLALLSMYGNSGKISFSNILKVLIVPVHNWTRKIKDSKNQLNVGYVETLLVSLIKGETISSIKSNQLTDRIEADDYPWHSLQLMNRMIMLKHRLGSWDQIVVKFAISLVDHLIPGIPEDLKNPSALSGRILNSAGQWSEITFEGKRESQAILFYEFYCWAEKLLGSREFYEFNFRNKLLSIEDLISLNEKFDRLLEVLDLVSRAKLKNNCETKARVLDKSPLKSLKFILKSNKRRPSWTFADHLENPNNNPWIKPQKWEDSQGTIIVHPTLLPSFGVTDPVRKLPIRKFRRS